VSYGLAYAWSPGPLEQTLKPGPRDISGEGTVRAKARELSARASVVPNLYPLEAVLPSLY
jgi:hypothetical protein